MASIKVLELFEIISCFLWCKSTRPIFVKIFAQLFFVCAGFIDKPTTAWRTRLWHLDEVFEMERGSNFLLWNSAVNSDQESHAPEQFCVPFQMNKEIDSISSGNFGLQRNSPHFIRALVQRNLAPLHCAEGFSHPTHSPGGEHRPHSTTPFIWSVCGVGGGHLTWSEFRVGYHLFLQNGRVWGWLLVLCVRFPSERPFATRSKSECVREVGVWRMWSFELRKRWNLTALNYI